jgi:LDH2 family malate/lactate/ureidoglycolate dehydrogenase
MHDMADLIHTSEPILRERVRAALDAAGADAPSAEACTRALLHASRLGIDSHGVRLTAHYVAMMRSGRVNPRPQRRVRTTGCATAMVDADDGLGHASAYAAMEIACELARAAGVGAVGVTRSSHFGAAGAYALAGAERGLIALATTNTDSLVALHGAKDPFHGTNPMAAAAPVPEQKPWLMDLATSSIPFNRVALARSLGEALPAGVAADAAGAATRDPAAAGMLLPLGGADFGYKGAGLAGLVALLSAVLTGGTLDHDMRPMFRTDDFRSPRNLGHFCLAIDPGHFVGRAAYDDAMTRYLAALRATPARAGERVLAPGDREWETEAQRLRTGIPIDADTAAFLGVSAP